MREKATAIRSVRAKSVSFFCSSFLPLIFISFCCILLLLLLHHHHHHLYFELKSESVYVSLFHIAYVCWLAVNCFFLFGTYRGTAPYFFSTQHLNTQTHTSYSFTLQEMLACFCYCRCKYSLIHCFVPITICAVFAYHFFVTRTFTHSFTYYILHLYLYWLCSARFCVLFFSPLFLLFIFHYYIDIELPLVFFTFSLLSLPLSFALILLFAHWHFSWAIIIIVVINSYLNI